MSKCVLLLLAMLSVNIAFANHGHAHGHGHHHGGDASGEVCEQNYNCTKLHQNLQMNTETK